MQCALAMLLLRLFKGFALAIREAHLSKSEPQQQQIRGTGSISN